MIHHDTSLQKYSPLSTILVHDRFNEGQHGWLDLRPNFVKPGRKPQSDEVDLAHWGPSMLSTATFPNMGTHGAMSGTYSLKLTARGPANPPDERPAPSSMGIVIKRLSQHADYRRIQLESWVAYTPEDDRDGLGDRDVRAFGCFLDLQSGGNRWQPGVRYVNSVSGSVVKRWQYFGVSDGVTDADWSYGTPGWHVKGIDPQWYGRRNSDGSSDGFQWLPGAEQPAVSNESDDKINWMYLRLTLDMKNRKYDSFQFMNRTYDMQELSPHLAKPYDGIDFLINPVFFVEADTDRRVFMYIDSVVLSVEGEA